MATFRPHGSGPSIDRVARKSYVRSSPTVASVREADDSMTDDICCAIARHRLLELVYNGQPRLIEPYSHGFSSNGQEMLVGFQRAGGSESGQVEGWKAMAVDRIERLVVVDVSFIPSRGDYRAGRSKNIDVLHCEI